MSKEDDYRKNAAETFELSRRSMTSADRGRLLRLAENWLDLADRAARLTKRFGPKRRPEFGPIRWCARLSIIWIRTERHIANR